MSGALRDACPGAQPGPRPELIDNFSSCHQGTPCAHCTTSRTTGQSQKREISDLAMPRWRNQISILSILVALVMYLCFAENFVNHKFSVATATG